MSLNKPAFLTNSQARVCTSLDQVQDFINHWHKARFNLNFKSDGLVIRLNSRRQFQQLGSTSHSPRAAIAFKYPEDQIKTTLKRIQLQIGRTGVVTPVRRH